MEFNDLINKLFFTIKLVIKNSVSLYLNMLFLNLVIFGLEEKNKLLSFFFD